jgi:hypothetical protein
MTASVEPEGCYQRRSCGKREVDCARQSFKAGLAGDGRHEDLVDALAIHVNNFKEESLPFKAVSFTRDALQYMHDKACQCVITHFLFNSKDILVNEFSECIKIKAAIDKKRSILSNHYQRLIFIVHRRQITNDALHQVVECHQASNAAKLIGHQGEMNAAALELLKNSEGFCALGHE